MSLRSDTRPIEEVIVKKSTDKKHVADPDMQRYAELKNILEQRRRELLAEVQGKRRGVREEGGFAGKLNQVLDPVETAETNIEEELELSLASLKSDTLSKIDNALARLQAGQYGYCACGEEIAEKRLKALPFAVRCKDCEEARETTDSA